MAAHRLTDLVVAVPDLAAARRFYREFGLEETEPGAFASVDGGEQLRLVEGGRGVASLGVGVDSAADLAAVALALRRLGDELGLGPDGLGVVERPDRLVAREPSTGTRVEVTVARRLPQAGTPGAGVGGAASRPRRDALVPREPVRPRRLGHVVLGSPDVALGRRFFVDGLGLRLSDHVLGGPFLRFGRDHHNVVLLPAPAPVLHHTAWKVRSIDEIGYGAAEMLRVDPSRHAWGLGRHAASANYFWYLRDPAGAFAEYYHSELDELADSDEFWDPVPGAGELPVAAWVSPPLASPLAPGPAPEVSAEEASCA